MKVKIKKLNENAIIPSKGTDSAAGYDLYALDSAVIPNGETVFVHTGIAVEIPEGYFGAIYARSGLACKHGLRPANCVGVIDSDYRGEIMVALHNDNRPAVSVLDSAFGSNPAAYTVEAGERIAQIIIQKFERIEFEEVDELTDTDRSDKGFGSTGTR